MPYPITRPLPAAAELLSQLSIPAVLVAAAKVFGSLLLRLGQPAVLGELNPGLVLGPSQLGLAYLRFLSTSEPHRAPRRLDGPRPWVGLISPPNAAWRSG